MNDFSEPNLSRVLLGNVRFAFFASNDGIAVLVLLQRDLIIRLKGLRSSFDDCLPLMKPV